LILPPTSSSKSKNSFPAYCLISLSPVLFIIFKSIGSTASEISTLFYFCYCYFFGEDFLGEKSSFLFEDLT